MVKSPGLAHASPKKTIALGCDFGDKATKSSSSVCSSNPAMKIRSSTSSMNSSSKVARETLDAIHNEASNEIIEKLLDRIEKILILACMIDNEYYFKKRAVLSKDWLHATTVKFSCVPKTEMTTTLLVARRQTPMCTPWTEDMLQKADEFYQVRGVERLFMYMGNLLLGDPLPVKCLFRPLPRAMVHRMVSVPFSASSSIDSVSGEIQFECYKFDGEQHTVWTRIYCNLNSHSILPLAVGGHDSTLPP